MDVGMRSLFNVNGTKVKEIYRIQGLSHGAIANHGWSLISTIALLLLGHIAVSASNSGLLLHLE